jgi:hypothetical protein
MPAKISISLPIFFALATVACPLAAQTAPPSRDPQRVEITLERREGSAWRAVDPGLVAASGDRVRFRFRANFDGYLYVMNYGTSGAYTLLYPREETGRDNRVNAGVEYMVPSTEAFFRIAGPPGQDIVYWLLSPVKLEDGKAAAAIPLPAPPKTNAPPRTLMPRCDDAMFRARGECIDSSAGMRALTEKDRLPENLSGVPGAASRELVIVRKQNQVLVSSPTPLEGPVIYEFRLAHR